jgi:hypothetical protein
MSKFQKTATLLGVANIEEQDGGVFLASDQVAAIEAALPTAEAAQLQLDLQAALDAKSKAESDLATAQSSLQTANEQLTEANTQLETLKKQSVTTVTKVAKVADENNAAGAEAVGPEPTAEMKARARVAAFDWTQTPEELEEA